MSPLDMRTHAPMHTAKALPCRADGARGHSRHHVLPTHGHRDRSHPRHRPVQADDPSMCPAFVPWIFCRDLVSHPPEYSPPVATVLAH